MVTIENSLMKAAAKKRRLRTAEKVCSLLYNREKDLAIDAVSFDRLWAEVSRRLQDWDKAVEQDEKLA